MTLDADETRIPLDINGLNQPSESLHRCKQNSIFCEQQFTIIIMFFFLFYRVGVGCFNAAGPGALDQNKPGLAD